MTEEYITDTAKAIADVIRGTVENMQELVGPLTVKEVSDITAVLTFQVNQSIIRRMRTGAFITHGVDGPEFACSDSDPTKMCPDCLTGFRMAQGELGLDGEPAVKHSHVGMCDGQCGAGEAL